jgi:hypothetical protein
MADNANNTKIWQEAVSATPDCPSIEVLEKVEAGSADANAQHVAGCAHCQTELAMLRSFEEALPLEGEGASVAWITAQLQRNQQKQAAPVRSVLAWRNLFRIPYMAAAAALIIAMTLGISLYNGSGKPGINTHIGNGEFRSGSVRLSGPIGNISGMPQQFQWEAFAGAVNYKVEVMEVDGHVDWSGTTAQTSITLAPEVATIAAKPGKPLQWKVTALDATDKSIGESSTERFQVAGK